MKSSETYTKIQNYWRHTMTKQLLLFTAKHCTACPEMKEIYNELQTEVTGIRFNAPINAHTDEGAVMARKYRVMSVPTLIYLIDGVTVGGLNGLQNKDDVLEMLGVTDEKTNP